MAQVQVVAAEHWLWLPMSGGVYCTTKIESDTGGNDLT
jgi:hypothetical protein